MEGLNWQTLPIPFASGLAQKSDDRARPSTALDIALDVQFDETGGLQTRLPYESIGASIFGGGTISNPRRIVEYDGELLLFTDVALYSWNAQLSVWVQKGTHLAVKVEEQPVFVDTGEQRECDRAELNGTIVYAWSEPTGSAYGGQVRVAALDKVTGSVLMAPTTSVDAGGSKMPRLVALSTKILLAYVQISGGNVKYKVLDPAAPSTAVASAGASSIYTSNIGGESYDITRIPGADAAFAAVASDAPGEGAVLGRIPATGAATLRVTSRIHGIVDVVKVAVAVSADGTTAMLVREGFTVKADVINPTSLADVSIDIAVGTTVTYGADFIACEFTSTFSANGPRCHIWWDENTTESSDDFVTTYNYVDAGNATAGTAATFVRRLGLASRAFEYDGDVYVWMTFGGETSVGDGSVQLQCTYFLYRHDGLLVAKAVASRGGGLGQAGSQPRFGVLPGVQLVSGTTGYAWCGIERRVIDVGTENVNYADRGPRDITFTFDSNEARRCVQLGETLYITGGEVMQYDGQQLTEVGFHIFPWAFSAVDGGAGSIGAGTYSYKPTLRWQNARGEIERSTTSSVVDLAIAANRDVSITILVPLQATHKTTNPPAAEVWRTAANPVDDSPFYLVTSKDPSVTANPNRYIANASTAASQSSLTDDLTDALLTVRAQLDEVAPIVRLAPPPASIIAAGDNRLFLAGIPGEPDRVWYSRLRNDGEIASFHGVLTVTIPRDGGDITALAFLNETLIVFRETSIYALPGDGFDNAGGGSNYGPSRLLSSDIGAVNSESVCFTPGGLVFKSSKGWYLLNRGWSLDYIGAAVTDYDSETPLAAHLVETQHQVRILTSSRMLVWDYLVQQWAEWTIASARHACVWDGAHVYLSSAAPLVQVPFADEATTYGLDVETAWIKPADLQGFSRVRKLQILGQLMSSDLTHLRIRIAYDYNSTYVDDKYWAVSPTTVNQPLQLKIGPRRQQVQAIKIRITAIRRTTAIIDDVEVVTNGAPTGEALKLTGLALEVGIKRNPYTRLPAAQRS